MGQNEKPTTRPPALPPSSNGQPLKKSEKPPETRPIDKNQVKK